MDNIFKTRVLTTAVNMMETPELRVYKRYFQGKEHLEPTDRLAIDVIAGSQRILGNISVAAPATVTTKTNLKTITLEAPRLSSKRFIGVYELNAVRAWGAQMASEMMQSRIAREQMDMRGEHDRTLEFWAVNALMGKIYDSDLTTVLVDYNLDDTHSITLTGDDLWSASTSEPIKKIRAWKKLIEDDAGTNITGFHAYVGGDVMDALLEHADVIDNMKYQRGAQIVETGRIALIAGVTVEEYNGSYIDADGTRQRFIGSDEVLLIGECADLVDTPYAPVVSDEAPGGVGNVNASGAGVLFFSDSWKEKDPDGRWIRNEARPCPALQRPGAIIKATVV